MKKFVALILVVILALSLTACGEPAKTNDEEKFSVGLVFSGGGLGDNGINDMMYGAMKGVCEKNAWEFDSLENESASNVEPSNRQYCEQGKDVIINFGFGCVDVVNRLAVEYPEIYFIVIDAVTNDLPNVKNYVFKEYEGSFLVGAIAGLMTETDAIGFVGGMENDMIKGFYAGYQHGAETVNPDIEVLGAFCGSTVEAFADPTKGKEIALSHFDRGADICYAAAGSSGLGMFEAAIEKGKTVIGVDVNQQAMAPDNMITSMEKRCDVAIIEALEEIAAGTFVPGLNVLGVAEGGVDFVNNSTNAGKLPQDVVDAVQELKAKIISGEIVVKDTLN